MNFAKYAAFNIRPGLRCRHFEKLNHRQSIFNSANNANWANMPNKTKDKVINSAEKC